MTAIGQVVVNKEKHDLSMLADKILPSGITISFLRRIERYI